MTTKDTSSDQDIPKNTESEPEPGAVHKRTKRRKHGYRGYPNNSTPGSSVHMGTGFGGVGSTRGAGSSGSGVITDKTREAVEENDEEESTTAATPERDSRRCRSGPGSVARDESPRSNRPDVVLPCSHRE
jgi:hypothetical protein